MTGKSSKTRDSALSAIKRYLNKSEQAPHEIDLETICCYQELLADQWSRFITAQDAIEIACGSERLLEEEDARVEAETSYTTAAANFDRLKKAKMEPAANVGAAIPVSSHIRLPQMDLPTFAGESTEWIPFHDAFLSLVDANESLTGAQKLYYLRGCLRGEALKLINNLKVCDANYGEAWELLKSRYRVMRIIVEGHLNALANLNKATVDSATAIKEILDPVLQHTSALKALGRPVQLWDDWLVHLVVHKLAFETRKHWELSLQGDQLATFDELKCFLEARCRSLATLTASGTAGIATPKALSKCAAKKSAYALYAVDQQRSDRLVCIHCKGEHKIYDCAVFAALDAKVRLKFISNSGACLNCLSSGHMKKKCRSYSACRICHQRHHTSLHDGFASDPVTSDKRKAVSPSAASSSNVAKSRQPTLAPEESSQNPQTTFAATAILQKGALHSSLSSNTVSPQTELTPVPEDRDIVLATAVVNVKDIAGRTQTARLLFDSGSHASFVTESCAQRLRLSRRPTSICITGIGSAHGGRAKGETCLTISSRHSPSKYFAINAFILANISNDLPRNRITVASWPHLRGLQLADPRYMHPGPIDILIGIDAMEQLLIPEIRKGAPGTPMAQRTVFGWTLFGCVSSIQSRIANAHTQVLHCELDKTLRQVWELEEPRNRKHLTPEESFCENKFESTHARAPDGRFVVELPLKEHIHLGDSRSCAVRSLLRMEKQFSRNTTLRDRYREFMRELIEMNHMEPVSNIPEKSYYMPHHAVIKESSTTTKLRVVFNASAKTSSGHSLNDALYIGPQLQDDLFSILLRFRTHRYAISADVAMMYRQIYVAEKHTDLQRIVWREDPFLPIQDYRMLRVTYGVAAASHLAVSALQHTVRASSEMHDAAASAILHDFYMDDLLTGASTVEALRSLQIDVSNTLESGGFQLRKWASNATELTDHLARTSKEMPYHIAESKEVHTLGLIWNTESDSLTFVVNQKESPPLWTKRKFLSYASTLFDPLGLLTPCTIKTKIWFQQIWRTDIGWDDPTPLNIAKAWECYRRNIKLLSEIKLSRWLGCGVDGSRTEFHVFADASELAYAAVMYARTVYSNGDIRITLMASKAKVAPLKITSLPRLELCAAFLASKLTERVRNWTDSSITLAWLQAHPSRWVTFVANRVAEIQELLPKQCWSHVRSEHNPADCASRGVEPAELLHHELWWNGPSFLQESDEFWKGATLSEYTTELEARKERLNVHVAALRELWPFLTKYSSYGKLKRVTAYVLRFYFKLRALAPSSSARADSSSAQNAGPLSYIEILAAEQALIRDKRAIPLRSNLLRLQPFLDENGILRVGGRINRAPIPRDAKNPVILAKGCPLAKLIVDAIHSYTLHAGPRIMQTVLQRRF